MHIAAADAARAHPHQHLVVGARRKRDVRELESPRRCQEERLQKPCPFVFNRTRIRYMSAVM
jgi:hypothetical protein